jgi:flagellar biosynthesis chaperone FliJ
MRAATSIEVLAQQLYQARKELDDTQKKLRELEGKDNGKAV